MTGRIPTAAVLTAAALIAVAGCSGSTSGAPRAIGLSTAASPTTASPTVLSPTAMSSTAAPNAADPWARPESPAAKAISAIRYRPEPDHDHLPGVLSYDSTPPIGGNHSQFWADCTGTVYPAAIANENAVHMLEHGAVWITYNPATLRPDQLATLTTLVRGVDRMALSPYPNLKTPISLQSWGYQLFVDRADDPRIQQFISALRYNPQVTPEYGATCSQPTFLQHPSTFGHPLWLPTG